MKKNFLVIISVIIFFVVNSSSATEISFTSAPIDSQAKQTYCWQSGNDYRPIFPLDGEWEYRVKEKDAWKKVVLPAHCDYSGELTFRKTFVPDSSFAHSFYRLVCYGINHYSMIFFNNKFIASHSSGYNSFYLNIADDVIKINEKNVLEIKVDTRLNARKTIPQKFQPDGFKSTNGIFRSLFLLALPELSIEKTSVQHRLNDDYSECELDVSIELKDRIDNYVRSTDAKQKTPLLQYRAELKSTDKPDPILIQTEIIPDEGYQLTRLVNKTIKLKRPRLWSPDSPSLYSLTIQIMRDKQIIDESAITFGIKDLDMREGKILLNGEHIVLRGVNWHEDYLQAGALLEPGQLYHDLKAIKQLSANAVRVMNHPAHPVFAHLCDSLGLLLLQDVPIKSVPPAILETDIFQKHSSDYLNEMIVRDSDHVSVFGWGIGGEFFETGGNFTQKVIAGVNDFSHIFYTWNRSSDTEASLDSSVIRGIDIFGSNRKKIGQDIPTWLAQNKNKINLVLSFGAPKLSSLLNSENEVLFEEYQVLQLVDAWQTIISFPEIDGYFVHSLSDFLGNYPSAIFGLSEDFNIRPTGLTDHSGKTRLAYETIRSLFQEGKCRYNPGVEVKTELPGIFPLVGIVALLILLFMINSRRYFRENFKRIFVHSHGFYVDMRDGRKTPPSHTIFMALFIATGCGLIQASLLYYFRSQPQIDHLLTLLLPWPEFKIYISQLSWQPEWATLVFSLMNLASFLGLSIFLKFIAIIIGKRFPFSQALTLPFWAGGNLVLFIVAGMVLFRVFQSPGFILPSLFFLAANYIWFIFRLIKAMRVIYIWSFTRAFITLVLTFGILIGGALYFYQYHTSILDYIQYYYMLYGKNLLAALSH